MLQKQSSKAAVIVPFKCGFASPDRRDFAQRLESSLFMAKQAGLRFSILALRLTTGPDNDRAEQEAVTRRLTLINDHLSQQMPSLQVIGRPWLDGLAIIDPSAQSSVMMRQRAVELIETIQPVLGKAGDVPAMRITLGIATYPGDGDACDTLLNWAHAASKRAEKWPISGFCFSSRNDGKEVASRLTQEGIMLRAFHSNEVGIDLHPILSLGQRRVVGSIAALRWHEDDADLASLPDMTNVELANAYSMWIAKTICRLNGKGEQTEQQRISVRVHHTQIASSDFATMLRKTLDDQAISAERVDVRFDAAALVDGTDHRLRAGFRELANLGVRLTAIHVDGALLPVDSMTTLPLSAIEFSSRLPQTIGRCTKSEAKLRALISFMRELGLETRCIDIVSGQQLAFLGDAGCDEISGPIVAR